MPTPKETVRRRLATMMQESARRLLVSGMHIHAGFGDADSRIRVMTAVRRYLPLLHALSTSSPFNAGRETGFKSYRLRHHGGRCRAPASPAAALWSRGGVSTKLVADYQRMKLIEDGSELWWDIRPSVRFPTIELRICDLCPRIEDAMCIAALYACLIRRLSRLNREGELPPEPSDGDHRREPLAGPALRRAEFPRRHPAKAAARTSKIPPPNWSRNWPTTPAPLAAKTNSATSLTIIREGTGADRQIDLFRLRRVEGDTDAQALRAVAGLVIEETREGIAEGG